ncbi:MAG: UbiX family flavin prenyltransferase [Chloroflexi bacterium]|nr:UbiX family flavin prenyltransferase [Chloroflexota bacterium]MYF78710.1 UbiX family flavin prenyltransferase [Chloroflexota bacterium]MYK62306.1 UbiX family flavin prenyltransferase [Chloroflexota bacterium]
MARYIVGISGASGAPYVRRVLQVLVNSDHQLDLVVTRSGAKVLEVEEGVKLMGDVGANFGELSRWLDYDMASRGGFQWHDSTNVAADIASGSCHIDGMLVAPCSGGTLARIANGMSQSLLERAADVTLKERRRLILMTRETPLSLIHLRNMVAVTEAGAIVLPASPGFYHNPDTIDDLIDMIAGRILYHLGLESDLLQVWSGR